MSYQDLSRADRRRWRTSLTVRCHCGRPVGRPHGRRLTHRDEVSVTFMRRKPGGVKVYTMLVAGLPHARAVARVEERP